MWPEGSSTTTPVSLAIAPGGVGTDEDHARTGAARKRASGLPHVGTISRIARSAIGRGDGVTQPTRSPSKPVRLRASATVWLASTTFTRRIRASIRLVAQLDGMQRQSRRMMDSQDNRNHDLRP